MGRSARGGSSIKLKDDKKVISLIISKEGAVLTTTANGYGKRTSMDDYPRHGRGGQGVISVQTTDRNGDVTGAELVQDDDEMMLITSSGTLVRTKVEEVSVMGRNTQGVRLIRLGDDEQLTGMARIANIQAAAGIEVEDSETDEAITDEAVTDEAVTDETTADTEAEKPESEE